MAPVRLLIKSHGFGTRIDGAIRQFADWNVRVQVEHAGVSPTQQRMCVRALLVKLDGLLQKLLGLQMLVHACAPHMRQRLDHEIRASVCSLIGFRRSCAASATMICDVTASTIWLEIWSWRARKLIDPQSYRSAHT